MIPMSMETLFLILSGAILVAGVMYWLWSHIQLTQKKVQILENAVFELRGMLTSGAATGPPAPVSVSAQLPTPETPKVYSDLEDDAAEDWDEAEEGEVRIIREVEPVSTPLEAVIPALSVEEKTIMMESSESHPLGREEEIPEDLVPGGRIQMSDTGVDADDEKQFRNLFSATVAASAASTPRTPESLESMPVKELRRLAAQRGIQGAEDMKKKEILAALRRQVTIPATVVEEKTLDISEVISETAPAAANPDDVDAEILE